MFPRNGGVMALRIYYTDGQRFPIFRALAESEPNPSRPQLEFRVETVKFCLSTLKGDLCV